MSRISLPDGAGTALRASLGLSPDAPLRIAYLPGPGDVIGTYQHWQNGQDDPRVPVLTYSAMFYDLVQALNAEALLVSKVPPEGAGDDPSGPIRFAHIAPAPSRGRWQYWRAQYAYGAALKARIDTFAPHVVVVATDTPASAWRGLGRGRRAVLSAHNTFWAMGQPPTGLKAQIGSAWLAHALSRMDAAVCTSLECARQVSAMAGRAVPCWVETPQQKQSFDVDKAPHLPRKICYLGRIETNKGVFDLLDAVSALAADTPDLCLDFIGDGGADDALAGRIAALDPDQGRGRIRALGRLGSNDVHAALAQADLLVCPTTTGFNEGFGLVVAEAAAHGTPSVTSSVVPSREMFAQACAVFAADDSAALRALLAHLLQDADAYGRLCAGTRTNLARMQDRSLGWGAQLYAAMTGPGNGGGAAPVDHGLLVSRASGETGQP